MSISFHTKINPFKINPSRWGNSLMKSLLRANQACVVKIAYNSSSEPCVNSLMCLEMADTTTYHLLVSTNCYEITWPLTFRGNHAGQHLLVVVERRPKFWSIITYNEPHKIKRTQFAPSSISTETSSPVARIANDFLNICKTERHLR